MTRSMTMQFGHARTCYGHLAGEVAVEILEAMLKQGWLAAGGSGYSVTPLGEAELGALDIDIDGLRHRRRVFARGCMDLTQRRLHLAGAPGDALLDSCVARGWVQRHRRSRLVNITSAGNEAFRRSFGLARA